MSKSDRIPVGEHVVIYQRGKRGIWTAEFTRDGKHCRKSLGTKNKKVALRKALQLEHELSTGTFRPAATSTPIASASDQYLSWLESEGRAPKTIVRYTGELKTFQEFCSARQVLRLSQIAPILMDAYRAERRQTHHANTIYHESMLIKQFLRWCESRDLISENPLRRYRLKKPARQPRPAPSLQQVQCVLQQAPAYKRVLLATLAFTGMRVGELRRLRREDVDLKLQWIHVVSRPGAETKTKTSRKIPIHPALLDLLTDTVRRPGPSYFSAGPSRIFPQGGHPISEKKLNEQFQRIAKKLGMPVGRDALGFTLHSLRRFFETATINAGVPQRAVDIWMGHVADKSMGATYYALSNADSQAFIQKVPFAVNMDA